MKNMISVMMPVYNAEKYVGQAIESVLKQTEKKFELIIVNDGSNDGSEAVIQSFQDARIRYFKKENGGESSARNFALKEARGEFIVFQDADDVSLPNRFERLLGQFSERVGFAHSDMLLIDENGSPIGYWQSSQTRKEKLPRFLLKTGTPYNNPSMMVRAELLKKAVYDENLKIGPDTDAVSQFAADADSVHVAEPLLLYRRHASNISKQSDYNILFAHVKKHVSRLSYKQMFPELEWERDAADEEIKAKMIFVLFAARRCMIEDAKELLAAALKEAETAKTADTKRFARGMHCYIVGDLKEALGSFEQIGEKSHVVENYMGEVYASAGNHAEAMKHFLKAVEINPRYEEPMDNIKAVGAAQSYNMIDNSWRKYIKSR